MENIQITTNKLNEEVDVQELAILTLAVWKITYPERNSTLEGIGNWIKNLAYDNPPEVVRAFKEDELVGWVLLFVHDSKRLEVNPWALGGHPFVHPDEIDKSEIAQLLLTECIEYALKTNFTRIELCYEKRELVEPKLIDPSIYQTCNLIEDDEIVLMNLGLADQEFYEVNFPDEIEVNLLKEVEYDKLYTCFYDSFCASGDRNFLSETDEERKEFFKGHYDKEEGKIEKASIALIDGEKVIGFVLVRPTQNEGNGHLWIIGVIPEYRGRHLGSKLLKHTINILKEHKYTRMSLAVDSSNEVSLGLYKKYNFIEGWRRITYVWKRNKDH